MLLLKKFRFLSLFALVIILTLFIGVHSVNAVKPVVQPLHSRIIVKFADGVDKKAVIKRQKGKIISEISRISASVIEMEGSENEALKRLRQEKVEYIEIDAVATTLITNDPLYSNQWALPKISWDRLDASDSAYNPAIPSTEIAVIDTGVDYNHPDLVGKVNTVSDKDFVNNDNDAMDDNLHGTHVAGIATANTNNNTGIAGISINTVKILPIKVLDQNGSGYYSWIANGIIYATDQGVKVINLSLGGNVKSTTLENAVNYAWSHGVVVVAAAGNSNNTSKTYPGAYSNAMAVWASDQNDNKASFSSYGSWVDIGAPGVSILSTIPLSKDTKDGNQDGYYLANGTSMATPYVAGLAGLVSSQNPSWTNLQIRNKIEGTADPLGGRLYNRGNLGKGRINVFRALTL